MAGTYIRMAWMSSKAREYHSAWLFDNEANRKLLCGTLDRSLRFLPAENCRIEVGSAADAAAARESTGKTQTRGKYRLLAPVYEPH
jgi:hypothetical protein